MILIVKILGWAELQLGLDMVSRWQHCIVGGGGSKVVGDDDDVKLGVGVGRWFLAFSTCSWNALEEQALHRSCKAAGVNTARQGVWKQSVYKAHLVGVKLRVNWRGHFKTEGLPARMRAATL